MFLNARTRLGAHVRLANSLVALALLISSFGFNAHADRAQQFPKGPDATITPGDICTASNTFRYPEHIKYCNRDVNSDLKNAIIADYDRSLGYSIGSMSRGDFKIDHYIPLCMGGSNQRENLWPQHKSVYEITDPLEPLACQKMADGKLLQARAIELIKKAKNDLSSVPEVMSILTNL